MKKRIVTAVLALALIAAMLAGCAAQSTTTAASTASASASESKAEASAEASESKTEATAEASAETSTEESAEATTEESTDEAVTVRTTFGPGELAQEQIDLFTSEHPNITVEVISADTTKLMSMIAAGTAPDYIRTVGVLEMASNIVRGIANDQVDDYLNNRAEYTKVDDLLKIADVYRWDGEQQGQGKLYGLPKDWSNDNGIFINKQLFTDAGIEIPSDTTPLTYSQVGEYAKKIQVMDGATPKIYGYCHGNGAFYNGVILAYNAMKGTKPWLDGFNTPNFDNDATKEYVNWVLDLSQTGASIITPVMQAPNNDPGGAFLSGQVGMWSRGYWFTGTMRSNENTKENLDNFMFLPTAQPDDSTQRICHCISATGGFILRQTKHFEEAAMLMDFHLSGPPASDRAKSGWGLPIYESMLDLLPMETEFDKQTAAVVRDEANYLEATINVNPYIAPTTMQALIDKYLVPVLSGDDTVDNALASINAEVAPLIAEGKEIAGVD